MKRIIPITLLLSCFAGVYTAGAQTAGIINGLVADEHQEPLAAVTVSLLHAKDSSLVKAAITDTSGRFEIERATGGAFLLGYSSMGYGQVYSAPFVLDPAQGFAAPVQQLQPESHAMKAVVISASKPMIEVQPGKVVFNVAGSINATGSNALELLQKSPGVQVSNEEQILLKGRSGVQVYIDGKATPLDAKTLVEYLKGISSSDVEAIEVIENPGARYDASGSAGVINIKLKKDKRLGMNGNAELGLNQGIWLRSNAALGLNYRNRKVNIFGNLGGNIGNRENELNLYRIQKGTIFDQKTIMLNKRRNLNLKAGADCFLDKKNTLGILATTNLGGGSFNTEGGTDIYDQASGVLQQKLKASNTVPMNHTNANFNLNYRYDNDSTGTLLSFDADYGLFRSTSNSYQPNTYYDPSDQFQYAIINGNNAPTDINIYTAKLDLEHKLWKGKIGYGLKAALVKTDNTFDFLKYVDGAPVKDMSQSNSFRYSENVNAAYVNYDLSLAKRWTLQAGLRLEQTNSKGELSRSDHKEQDDNIVKRSYLDFFPNVLLGYQLSEDHLLNLHYTRRIERPDYQDLNPFENKLDQMTYEKGNAFLRPEYADKIELSYTFKSALSISAAYADVKDYAVTVTDTINEAATFIQKQNIASQKIYAFSISTPLPIAKWWTGYVSIWYRYQVVKGAFNGIELDFNAPGYGGYTQQTFLLGKGYSAELSAWFNGKGVDGTWEKSAMASVDAGLQKRFLDNKASIKITATDIFRTTRFRGGSNYGGTNLSINQQNENQTIRLSFSYRFGNSQVKAARQRETASESEGNRIK